MLSGSEKSGVLMIRVKGLSIVNAIMKLIDGNNGHYDQVAILNGSDSYIIANVSFQTDEKYSEFFGKLSYVDFGEIKIWRCSNEEYHKVLG